jgi:ATP-binding cassette subfamily B protein
VHVAQESFSGLAVIKAYVREAAEALRFGQSSKKLYDKSMSHLRYSVIVNIIIDAMISLVILSIIAYGSILIAQSNLSSGELTEYISYFFTILWPVFAISWFLNINGQAQASASEFNFMKTKPIVGSTHPTPSSEANLDGSLRSTFDLAYPDATVPFWKTIVCQERR